MRRIDDHGALAGALAARCDALAGPDHIDARRTAAEEIIGSARRTRDRLRELLGRRLRLVALAEAGEWATVDTEIETYAKVAATTRQPGLAWYVPLWRGARARMRADPDAVREHTAELQRAVELSGSINAQMLLQTQSFIRDVDEGRPSLTLAIFDEFVRIAPEQLGPASYCTLALLRALNREPDEAARLLRAFLDSYAVGTRDSEWLPAMAQAAMTADLLVDRTAAASIYTTIHPYQGIFAVEGILAGSWGCIDAHLGRLAQLLGRPEVAEQHFAAAMPLDAAAGPALAARTQAWASGVADRVRFIVADITDPALSGRYDAVLAFEVLHDLAHPVAALRTARRLSGDGAAPVVIADERVGERLTAPADPMERFFYASSVLHCLPVGRCAEHSAETGTMMRRATAA